MRISGRKEQYIAYWITIKTMKKPKLKKNNMEDDFIGWYLSTNKIPDTKENREGVQIAMDAIKRAVKAGGLEKRDKISPILWMTIIWCVFFLICFIAGLLIAEGLR